MRAASALEQRVASCGRNARRNVCSSRNPHTQCAGLRQLGFDYVFDTDFAADLTIMEEGTELLQRLRQAWGLEERKGALRGAVLCLPSDPECVAAGVIASVTRECAVLAPHTTTPHRPAAGAAPCS
jgi:hypothetical protein